MRKFWFSCFLCYVKMAFFCLNKEFNNFEEVLQAKIDYEKENNVVLVKRDTHLLKGAGELVKDIVYSRLSLQCKAGKERPSEGKGMRQSSTLKKNCPMKINLTMQKNNKLKVTSLNDQHANHQVNAQTFRHYPENVRLSPNEQLTISSMIETNANKRKIKVFLMEKRLESGNSAPVSLKSIHNAQTKHHKEKESLHVGENELQRLLDSMIKVPGAKVHVLRDENNELVCIFFQDERMSAIFEKFPELVLFDATYNMNNHDMPLFVQSVVDGNGETEIVFIGICRSESRVVVEFLLDTFKSLNPSWQKVKCVVGDKDFADRIVYTEKFDGVALQICLFHVLRTFNREITTAKRNITKEQRDEALKILQSLCYARSQDIYDEHYEQLSKLNLPQVMDYFNSNWHNIREEWTLYDRNEYTNFLNSTNSRSESMNAKLKMIGNRHSNLLSFFENVSTSLRVLASEKDLKAVRSEMRTIRVRFDDATLRNYNEVLTPFIFIKLQDEYANCDQVEFPIIDSEAGITHYGRTVTSSKCCCTFHKSMNLPCRHIFKFREINKIDLFAPEICDPRWAKQYYRQSHPALTTNEDIPTVAPIYVQRVRIPAEKDKYKASASVTKQINSMVTSLSTGEFNIVMDKLKKFRDDLSKPSNNLNDESVSESIQELCGDDNYASNAQEKDCRPLDLSVPTSSARSKTSESAVDFYCQMVADKDHSLLVNSTSNTEEPPKTNQSQLPGSQLVVIASTSSQAIRSVTLPSKRKSVGRPKGSVNNAIGLKRKNATKVQKSKKVKVNDAVQAPAQIGRVLRNRVT